MANGDTQVQIDPSQIPDSGDMAELSRKLGISQNKIVQLRRQKHSGSVTGDEGKPGQLEVEAFKERTSLGGNSVIGVQPAFWDKNRGVTVHAPFGKMFELLDGGGVRVVDAQDKVEPTKKTDIFQQDFIGNEGERQKIPGFISEELGVTPAQGKTIKRVGRSGFNPATGVDVNVGADEVFIEYEDGTFEVRKMGSINQPGEARPLTEAGPTAEELGITRDTEIKGPGGVIVRAPFSAKEALERALAESPEAADEVIVAEGQASTKELTLLSKGELEKLASEGKTPEAGNTYFRAPDGTLLERPEALAPLAKQPVADKGAALGAAEAPIDFTGTGPSFSADLMTALEGMGVGISGNEQALIQELRNRPTSSPIELYEAIQAKQGVKSVQGQINYIQDQMASLDNEFAENESEIMADPWISEGEKQGRLKILTDKFQRKRELLVNRLQLNQSLVQDARQEAQFLTSMAVQQANADRAFDLELLQLSFQRADQAFANKIAIADIQLKEEGLKLEKLSLEQSARQFEKNLQLNLAQLDLQREQIEISTEQFNKNFDENVRQFGLNYALEQARLNKPSGGGGSPFAGIKSVQGGLFNLNTGEWVVEPVAETPSLNEQQLQSAFGAWAADNAGLGSSELEAQAAAGGLDPQSEFVQNTINAVQSTGGGGGFFSNVRDFLGF